MPLSTTEDQTTKRPVDSNAYAHAEGILNAPVEQVWQIARDFGNLGKWHPSVKESFVVGESPAVEVGVVRQVILESGEVILERLTELDDHSHRLAYTFDAAPFPIDNYAGVIELRPHDEGSTEMKWYSRFKCPDDVKTELESTLTSAVYKAGIDALKSQFSS